MSCFGHTSTSKVVKASLLHYRLIWCDNDTPWKELHCWFSLHIPWEETWLTSFGFRQS